MRMTDHTKQPFDSNRGWQKSSFMGSNQWHTSLCKVAQARNEPWMNSCLRFNYHNASSEAEKSSGENRNLQAELVSVTSQIL